MSTESYQDSGKRKWTIIKDTSAKIRECKEVEHNVNRKSVSYSICRTEHQIFGPNLIGFIEIEWGGGRWKGGNKVLRNQSQNNASTEYGSRYPWHVSHHN